MKLTEREFSAAPGKTVLLHERNLLAAGLGEAAELDAHVFRRAAGAAIMALKRAGRSSVVFDLAAWPQFSAPALEGAILADYAFDEFKPERLPATEQLRIKLNDEAEISRAKATGRLSKTICNAVNVARHLNNQPGNLFYPETLVEAARKLAAEHGMQITVLDEKALQARGFGGILAVGCGSVRPPRLIILEHLGGPASQAPLALVGKAVTFDTGGISIKPAANMEAMVFDKSGGLAVLGAMSAIAALKIKRNVVGIIPAAENMPGGGAYRPGDIVTMYDGKTVEIVNTDAEGRMLLADAIAFARKDKKASAIIDLATLTGACGVALGESAAGLWTSSDELRTKIMAAAAETGERLWPMPLYPEYGELIKSKVALVKNAGGRLAGASTAAAFLKIFAEKTPWAHLDIAFMAENEKDKDCLARGATGFGIRTLVELAERL